MHAIIYLDRNRRAEVYEAGGFQQERFISFNGKNREYSDWQLANDEDWPDLKDAITKFKDVFNKIEENLISDEFDEYKQSLVDKFGQNVIEEAESYYETDFDKEFWRDLDKEEQLNYIMRAKHNLKK